MVKSVISVIVATALIAFGAVYENLALKNTFGQMILCTDELTLKLEDETCTVDDILSLQTLWIRKKEGLHVYIPHAEIKELDLWIAECVSYVKFKKYDEAISKLTVVKELCEQIPKTFSIRFENLF